MDYTKSAATQPYEPTKTAQEIAKRVSLEDLTSIIRSSWEKRFERGRITHIHQNAVQLPNGSYVHLRVMIQSLSYEEVRIHTHDDKDLI